MDQINNNKSEFVLDDYRMIRELWREELKVFVKSFDSLNLKLSYIKINVFKIKVRFKHVQYLFEFIYIYLSFFQKFLLGYLEKVYE